MPCHTTCSVYQSRSKGLFYVADLPQAARANKTICPWILPGRMVRGAVIFGVVKADELSSTFEVEACVEVSFFGGRSLYSQTEEHHDKAFACLCQSDLARHELAKSVCLYMKAALSA